MRSDNQQCLIPVLSLPARPGLENPASFALLCGLHHPLGHQAVQCALDDDAMHLQTLHQSAVAGKLAAPFAALDQVTESLRNLFVFRQPLHVDENVVASLVSSTSRCVISWHSYIHSRP